MLLLEMRPNDVNNLFWKLVDTSKQISDPDSTTEIPVVEGSGGYAKAQARNVVFCSNYPICEFVFWCE